MRTKLIILLALAPALAVRAAIFTNICLPGNWPAEMWWTNSPLPTEILPRLAWLAEMENWRRASNALALLGAQTTNATNDATTALSSKITSSTNDLNTAYQTRWFADSATNAFAASLKAYADTSSLNATTGLYTVTFKTGDTNAFAASLKAYADRSSLNATAGLYTVTFKTGDTNAFAASLKAYADTSSLNATAGLYIVTFKTGDTNAFAASLKAYADTSSLNATAGLYTVTFKTGDTNAFAASLKAYADTSSLNATSAIYTASSTKTQNATNDLNTAIVGRSYLTANQTVTLSGDATGSGTTAITVTATNLSTPGGSAGQRLFKAASGIAWSNAPCTFFCGTTGNLAPTPAATTFFYPPNNSATNTVTSSTAGVTRVVIPRGGILRNLYATFSAAAGSGKTSTVTIYQNGSASALTAQASNATTASDVTHSVTVAAGDVLDVCLQVSSGGTVTKATWGFELD